MKPYISALQAGADCSGEPLSLLLLLEHHQRALHMKNSFYEIYITSVHQRVMRPKMYLEGYHKNPATSGEQKNGSQYKEAVCLTFTLAKRPSNKDFRKEPI